MGMRFGPARLPVVLLVAVWLAGLSCGLAQADARPMEIVPLADPSGAPVLTNPGFECKVGYVKQVGIQKRVPLGWTGVVMYGAPELDSTRTRWTPGGCYGTIDPEKLEGEDSLLFRAQDLETPPEPGKPFDAAVYQQVAVTPGTAYSLSGWMVSLCGGSATPSSCPTDYYMEKLLGIDPTGGTDPLGPSVIWVGDRRNFTETRWLNLRLAATAQTDQLTVFGRIRSPFQWHGNHAFADAFSLVRAPTAYFVNSPARISDTEARVQWDGVLSPEIQAIPGSTTGYCLTCSTGSARRAPGSTGSPISRRGARLSPLAAARGNRPMPFGCAAGPNNPKDPAPSRTIAIPASGASRRRSSWAHQQSACPAPILPLVLR